MKRLAFVAWIYVGFSFFSVYASERIVDELDRQRFFVDQVFASMERDRLEQEALAQARIKRMEARKKKRDELRVAEQFAGLSQKLSGLPEIPKFRGTFSSAGIIPGGQDGTRKADS